MTTKNSKSLSFSLRLKAYHQLAPNLSRVPQHAPPQEEIPFQSASKQPQDLHNLHYYEILEHQDYSCYCFLGKSLEMGFLQSLQRPVCGRYGVLASRLLVLPTEVRKLPIAYPLRSSKKQVEENVNSGKKSSKHENLGTCFRTQKKIENLMSTFHF